MNTHILIPIKNIETQSLIVATLMAKGAKYISLDEKDIDDKANEYIKTLKNGNNIAHKYWLIKGYKQALKDLI